MCEAKQCLCRTAITRLSWKILKRPLPKDCRRLSHLSVFLNEHAFDAGISGIDMGVRQTGLLRLRDLASVAPLQGA